MLNNGWKMSTEKYRALLINLITRKCIGTKSKKSKRQIKNAHLPLTDTSFSLKVTAISRWKNSFCYRRLISSWLRWEGKRKLTFRSGWPPLRAGCCCPPSPGCSFRRPSSARSWYGSGGSLMWTTCWTTPWGRCWEGWRWCWRWRFACGERGRSHRFHRWHRFFFSPAAKWSRLQS